MSTPRETVDELYAAIKTSEPGALELVFETGFALDAVLSMPPSLPYGGEYEGRDTIKGLMLALIGAKRPMVLPASIAVQRVIEQGDQIVAEVSFSWQAPDADAPISMQAVEWFTIRDGLVAEMKVYYRDTAAVVAALNG